MRGKGLVEGVRNMTFTSSNMATFAVGQNNSFVITTSGGIPSLSASGIPSGVTFKDNHNGTATLIANSLTDANVGTFTLLLTATLGATVTPQTLTLYINSDLPNAIRSYNPDVDFYQYLLQQKSWQEAWDNCARGDWMLWLLGQVLPIIDLGSQNGISRLTNSNLRILQANLDCAELAMANWSTLTISTPDQWGPGSYIAYSAISFTVADKSAFLLSCFRELVSWVQRGMGVSVQPASITPTFDIEGFLSGLVFSDGGTNMGLYAYMNWNSPVFKHGGSSSGPDPDVVLNIQNGIIQSATVTSGGTGGYSNFLQLFLEQSIGAGQTAILAYWDLYFLVQYMNTQILPTSTVALAIISGEYDRVNAAAFASRALYEAAYSIWASVSTAIGGGAAADAARSLALAARADFSDAAQAAASAATEANATYLADQTVANFNALNSAKAALTAALQAADAAYNDATSTTLAQCASIVRTYYSGAPVS